jgi:Fe-S-cluster-containing hydrogenase component 2
MTVIVDRERCDGCGTCVEACPNGAISLEMGIAKIDDELCTCCEACVSLCPTEAIKVEYVPAATRQNEPQPEAPIIASTVGVRSSIEPKARVIRIPRPAAVQEIHPRLTDRLGTVLAFLGREVLPYVLDGLATTLEQRIVSPSARASSTPAQTAVNGNAKRIGQGSHARRRKRIRRGRYS